MSRFRIAGLLAVAELAVAIVRARGGGDLLRESTLDRFRRGERWLALAASVHTGSAAYVGR